MIQSGRSIFIALFLIITVSLFVAVSAAGGDLNVNDGECIKRYNITRDKSPWSGFTSSYEDEEGSKKIASLTLEGSDYKSLPSLVKYKRSGSCIIGRNEKLRRIAVEASLFSELKRADATAGAADKILIGRYRDIEFRVFSSAELAEFLLESQIINTYWHVESDFCLVAERETSDEYSAVYKGKHIYYTNSENEGPLDFSIIIDRKTGNIYLKTN